MAVILATLSQGGEGAQTLYPNWIKEYFVADDTLEIGGYYSLQSGSANYIYVVALASPRIIPAVKSISFYDDYYNRIHTAPNPMDLGNLLSDQIRELTVWNSYTTSQLLSTLTEQDTDGITVLSPDPAPTTYAPFEERTYIVNTSTIGPPTIDATLTFSFPDGLHNVSIIGTRVVLWRWIPDGEYKENLEFYTHILKTRSSEQRIAMREAPRQSFDLSFTKRDHEFTEIKIAAKEWVARLWGCPVWREQSTVSAAATATAINFDTTSADYRDGGLVMLWETPDKAAAVEIDTVRVDGIDLSLPLSDDWTNALVMPLRLARIKGGVDISRKGAGITNLSASFHVTDNVNLSESAYIQYLGYDVFTDEQVVQGGLSERISVPIQEFDNGSGPVVVETLQDFTDFSKSIGRLIADKAGLWTFRKWLHSRMGKQKAFWLPSWNKDFVVVADITALAVLIAVQDVDASLYVSVPFDIMLKTTDGNIQYRRVSNISRVDGIEYLTIDSAVGAITTAEVDICCLMALCRLNADKIELNHDTHTKTTIPVIEVPDGV